MKEKIEEIYMDTLKLTDDEWVAKYGEGNGYHEAFETLIQEERKKDREMIYKDIQANYHITADEFYKHYLQSLDKGDTDENR